MSRSLHPLVAHQPFLAPPYTPSIFPYTPLIQPTPPFPPPLPIPTHNLRLVVTRG